MHVLTFEQHLSPRSVDAEVAGLDRPLIRSAIGSRGMTQPHPYAGDHFGYPKGLGKVIVRTRIEGGDRIRLLVSRGECEYRCRRPPTEPPNPFESIHVGKVEVEDHDVWATGLIGPEPRSAGYRLDETELLAQQRGPKVVSNRRIVFDQKDDGPPLRSGDGSHRSRVGQLSVLDAHYLDP